MTQQKCSMQHLSINWHKRVISYRLNMTIPQLNLTHLALHPAQKNRQLIYACCTCRTQITDLCSSCNTIIVVSLSRPKERKSVNCKAKERRVLLKALTVAVKS